MATKQEKVEEKAREEGGVATARENEKLEHSQGGATTRDALDAGVPMLPGAPAEPVGPEDAFGEGEKRGDYRNRQDGSEHFESVAVEGGGEPVTRKTEDAEGNEIEIVVDSTPVSRLAAQTPRTEQIGEVEGKKGGVDTA